MKLSKKERQKIDEIICSLSITTAYIKGKKVWDCQGFETKISKELDLVVSINKVSVDLIVREILEVLGTADEN